MAQSIHISDDRYSMAQNPSQARARPLTQQQQAADISASMAMELLGNGASAVAFVAAALGHGVQQDGGLPMLKERQRKDAEDVAAGRRSARSLLMFQKDDLKGYRFTPNPASEFERNGDGW